MNLLTVVLRVANTAAETVTFIGFFAGGAACDVMRFSQILKIYTRLRYIGVFFGERLTDFLEQLSEAYNDSEREPDLIQQLILSESGYSGKISQYNVFPGP